METMTIDRRSDAYHSWRPKPTGPGQDRSMVGRSFTYAAIRLMRCKANLHGNWDCQKDDVEQLVSWILRSIFQDFLDIED